MAARSPAEIITESFYAWELRGRGWEVADYPVALEPPFRPFFILPNLIPKAEVTDDGYRATLLSSAVDSVRGLFQTPSPPPEVAPFEELAPFPAERPATRVCYRLSIPEGAEAHTKAAFQLLSALGTTYYPVSFDLVGINHAVHLQVTCADIDAGHVSAQLTAFAPEVAAVEETNSLPAAWRTGAASLIVDVGLSDEFFLPLSADCGPLDPYVTLIPALAAAGSNETLTVQVLFEGVRNPWGKAIRAAVTDEDGESRFLDATNFPRLADEKVSAPMYAVCLRIGAQAATKDRALALVRGVASFLRQFSRNDGNSLIPLENDSYPEEAHVAAFLDYETNRTGMVLSLPELAMLAHIPDKSVVHPAFARVRRATKAAPPRATEPGVLLGYNRHRGQTTPVSVPTQLRLQHTWIVGATGTGKSTLLHSLVRQDIEAGRGVALLDPHGDTIDDLLPYIPESRWNDVVLFDPADTEFPVGFNLFEADSDVERTLIASDLVGVFRRLSTSWGDTMNTVLGNAVLAILEHPDGGTLLELRRFLVDEAYRKHFLGAIADEEIRFFWDREYPLIGKRSIGPILTRLDTFLRPRLIRHIVGQRTAKLRLKEVVSSQKIFLAKLSTGLIGEENAALLGSLLLGRFQQIALSRQQIGKEERTPYYLCADEFHHFVTPSLETMLSGGRKYGLALTLIHQTLSQLDNQPRVESALMGNAATRIVFRLGEQDARKLAAGFSGFTAEDLANLGQGEAVIRLEAARDDCNVETVPTTVIRPSEAEAVREAVVALSREQYGTPLASIRIEIGSTTSSQGSAVSRVALGTKPRFVGENETAAPPRPIEDSDRAKAPRKSRVEALLASEDLPTPGRGGPEHKYLQHLVKRLAVERGFRATIEGEAGGGRADVVLRKDGLAVAVEISITTDVAHEAENIKKCMAGGFTHVIFLSPDNQRRKAIKARYVKSTVPLSICAPEEVVSALDAFEVGPLTAETTVRGYKVKVKRKAISREEVEGKREAVAAVVAKTLRTRK